MARHTLLVTYELNGPDESYKRFFDLIDKADDWGHFIENSWIIISDETAETWGQRLSKHVKTGDRLIVVEVILGSSQGWLPTKNWEWIKERS
jgi:hypothetical protein